MAAAHGGACHWPHACSAGSLREPPGEGKALSFLSHANQRPAGARPPPAATSSRTGRPPCREWPVTSRRPRSGTWGQEGKTNPNRNHPWSFPDSSQKIPSKCRPKPGPCLGLGVPLPRVGEQPSPTSRGPRMRQPAQAVSLPTLWDTATGNICLPRKTPSR